MRLKTIGFIGLGRMGFPMAGHLLKAGFRVLGHDSARPAREAFAEAHGAQAVAAPATIGAEADAVITMLPTSAIVREVMLGADGAGGIAAHMRADTVLIDMSTSDPHDTRALGSALAERGIAMVDAPVAGGVIFARDASLDILTGGDKAWVEAVEPVLLAMGRRTVYCGPLGAAHAMKALNNYVNAAVLGVYLEALVAGSKFGITLETMLASLEATTLGRNHPLDKKIKPHVLTRSFASGMAIELIAKDVGIARRLAELQGVPAPLARAVHELWQEAARSLGGARDQTEIARFWEESAGLALRGDGSKA